MHRGTEAQSEQDGGVPESKEDEDDPDTPFFTSSLCKPKSPVAHDSKRRIERDRQIDRKRKRQTDRQTEGG